MDVSAKITSLLKTNADHAEWKCWKPSSWAWKYADDDWQAFATKWQGRQGPVHEVVNGAPVLHIPDICDDMQGEDFPPSLLVRACYEDAVHAIMHRAAGAPRTGMIFTGQPGIVVLLTLIPKSPLLFYRGRVWEAKKPPTKSVLPKRRADAFIWSLFEANESDLAAQTVYANKGRILFPVQAPSPNPSLYTSWWKRRNPVFSAFPLWDLDELKQGLRLHDDFARLQGQVGSMLETWGDRSRDLSFEYSRALQLLRAACGDQRPDSVDMALDVLIDASITAFGCIARDVFKAILDPGGYDDVLETHADAYKLEYEVLKTAACSHYLNHVPRPALCIRPFNTVGEPVEWFVDFKSHAIAEQISEKWADAQDGRVRELMAHLSSVPAGKGKPFVGWLFKSLAHGRIEAADGARAYWPLRPMTLQEPSTFVLDISAQSIPMIRKKNRRRVTFDMESITSERLVLRDDEYYVPAIPNFPLIDSFLVSFERGSSATEALSADLWLFQMTTSAHHRDSSTGYVRIRNIVSILQHQLSATPTSEERRKPDADTLPVVRLHYVLACPAGEPERIERWTLPLGWDTTTRGDGYLKKIDVR
ncbi:hypothetical protein C8Q74DRAFT_1447677 [Fomes fomentarius]|nr:hypothetical protein C8Q74DRAFT_1447677 [Fomes fomentarius]